uniref:Uncharacterized protein n=1 Tax=Pectinophora gossypiella TaxID=13191 RepID=A0A1E1WDK9_PECGO
MLLIKHITTVKFFGKLKWLRDSISHCVMIVLYRHGDLSKPSTNARGRMTTIRRWEELTTFLNSDGSGDTKTTEKWKKEINIERNMPDPVEEIRLPSPSGSTQAEDIQIIQIAECTDSLNEPGPSRRDSRPQPPVQMPPPTSPPPHHVEAVVIVENAENRISPVPPPHADATQAQPALSGQTTPRRSIRPRVSRTRPSPRRLVRPTQTEQAAQHFLHSDEEWRKFKIQQHRDNVEMARDKNRVREMEVETQRAWLALGSRVLDLVDKVVNKFCKD